MGTDSIITLFFLIVAALVFMNLRNVLGKRTGHEKQPNDAYSPKESPRETERPATVNEDGKVITLSRRSGAEPENRYQDIDDFAAPGSPLNTELRKIVDVDASFNPKQFVEGARAAYEMIVTAFAEGDRKTLRSLLSNEVYEGFNAAITQREKAEETVKFTFVGIERAEMVDAGLDGTEVSITVRILCQLISATYDKAGALVDGNAENVTEVNDRWTYLRDTRSRDPNWKLVSTQSEG
jgi:predicted lipid-binding transport protein (Tim44 family)